MPLNPTEVPKIRRAEPADAAGLVRLRAQMLADMGRPVGGADDPWRASAVPLRRLHRSSLRRAPAHDARPVLGGEVLRGGRGDLEQVPPKLPASRHRLFLAPSTSCRTRSAKRLVRTTSLREVLLGRSLSIALYSAGTRSSTSCSDFC